MNFKKNISSIINLYQFSILNGYNNSSFLFLFNRYFLKEIFIHFLIVDNNKFVHRVSKIIITITIYKSLFTIKSCN